MRRIFEDKISGSHAERLGLAKALDMMREGDTLVVWKLNRLGRSVKMERELIVERTRAGLDVARQLGRKGGRKRQMTDSKIVSAKKLLVSGVPPKDVAKNLGVSLPTLYR